ncbi:MAG: phosphoribosylamine--glycine ligase [Gammaproteobacteria bacterium]|nr:phosphoribosylamine--glycine ligase [Gammaproteobacteria bacterium]
MNVLLLGKGGREHAIGWKLSQSSHLRRLISLPGNPGLARLGDVKTGVDPSDPAGVTAFARSAKIDLVVVGPEAPLAAGVADALRAAGVAVFGPDRAAARLETSKSFAKEIMAKAGVPTGSSVTFSEDRGALAHLERIDGPFVVKADGLAAGKGVLVTEDIAEARHWVRACFDGRFGDAGSTVVIEEYLPGEEISVFGLTDGTGVIGLRPARDYKRLRDGDAGPNTGGMGSFTPVEGFDDAWVQSIVDSIIKPVLGTLSEDGIRYVGFIYAGIVLTPDGPKVLEFNCRLGDPETQAILPTLDSDLLELIGACIDGTTGNVAPRWNDLAAVNVVLAAAGYPEAPVGGDRITGLDSEQDNTLVFHAGTREDDGRLVTAGGRVLSVIGLGPDVASARARAYDRVATIGFNGHQYRKDIAG